MAKTDAPPLPDTFPKKRRQIEEALDIHLRLWVEMEGLPPGQRRKAQEEIERRRRLRPDVKLAIIAGPEGVTPEQVRVSAGIFKRIEPTHVLVVGQARKLARLFVDIEYDGPLQFSKPEDVRDVLRNATVAVCYPKETFNPNVVDGVWDAVRFAKHRSIPVRAIMPDGKLYERMDQVNASK
jgi:hypothetical protein